MLRISPICGRGRIGRGVRTIQIATSVAQIERCFPVMHQLRPALVAEEFAGVVQAMQAEGYHLAFLESEGAVVSVAGYRVQGMLASGKTLYVDDLVTDAAVRSQGHGEAMLRWLIGRARDAGCATFSLDSGTHRQGAHAFYFRQGMRITSFHFALLL